MLVIHLFRVGKKNQPSFKIVVAERGKPTRAGRFVEEVGFYNPVTKEKVLKQERIKYWISVGAQPSPTAFNLFVSEKIIEGKKIDVHTNPKKKEEKPGEPAVAPAAEVKPKEETPPNQIAEKPAEEKPKETPAAAPEKPVEEKTPEPKSEPIKETEPPKEEVKAEAPKSE